MNRLDPLDSGFPHHERFPPHMEVIIWQPEPGTARMTINGQVVGDPLRDNNFQEDGYRFHDVFHVAHAAFLGWSPVLRASLRLKRKSIPDVDHTEDGGRAIVTEEGIVAMVFSYARNRDFLLGATALDPDLLLRIREMTSHLEVHARTPSDWERAILAGFQTWRRTRNWKGIRIDADLTRNTLDSFPPQTPRTTDNMAPPT